MLTAPERRAAMERLTPLLHIAYATSEFGGISMATPADMRADIETVSYTHLRAHETVLDLVCRLLLEKTKNKQKKKKQQITKKKKYTLTYTIYRTSIIKHS